jgi:DNA-binding NarL/FixJ family response regulator
MPIAAIHHQLVLVMHSEPIVARGLVAALEEVPGLEVRVAHPDEPLPERAVVVCEDAIARALSRALAGAALVVLARTPREFEIQLALERGALGYLVTGCRIDELQEAVRTASRGRRFLCRATAQEIANGFSCEALTTREHDVLALLARGSCNKTIANGLDIALGTVKAHVRSIMGKLKASSRTEAASIAAARGLVSPGLAAPEPARRPAMPRCNAPTVRTLAQAAGGQRVAALA